MRLPYVIKKLIPGYEVEDTKVWFKNFTVEIYLKKVDPKSSMNCRVCGTELTQRRGKHRMRVKHLPIFQFTCFLIFWRDKGHCPNCKKARSEQIDFLSPETPHLSLEYSWWLGNLTEISTVSRVAELTGNDQNTLWRIDFDRLLRMLQDYEIPDVRRISVDEVHARSKKRYSREPRHKQYFTVISDMKTGRVIWVSENREKAALDEFYKIIGPERCQKIEVVAMDQYRGYKTSTEEYCPNALVVWDRFHVMRNFEDCLNEERKLILERNKSNKKLVSQASGRFKYIFLKKAKRRTPGEKESLNKVMKENRDFYKLELIKEKFFHFFNQRSAEDAREIVILTRKWIEEGAFEELGKWVENFISNWETIKNYFKCRVTSALSEGQNNVIKTLKRRCYGLKNMTYFKLKILQVCGFLNSKYMGPNRVMGF